MIGLPTKVLRRVLLVELELLAVPEHMSLLMGFSWVRIAKSSVLCAVFCHCLSYNPEYPL